MIEATLDEIQTRIAKLAGEPCPSPTCRRRTGEHTSSELVEHCGEAWTLLRPVFDGLLGTLIR